MKFIINLLDMKIPQHIAIIMDGNRRWARSRGYSDVVEGHKAGAQRIEDIARAAVGLGVKYLSLYTFSTENFKRSLSEKKALFELFIDFAVNKKEILKKEGVGVEIIGNLNLFPQKVVKAMQGLLDYTAKNSKLRLGLCFGYGGRDEIVNACRGIINNSIKAVDLTENVFNEHLYSGRFPDIDIMIRTGGDYRISNFLLWKIAYAELFFTKTMWPDFDGQKLLGIIKKFNQRERRFGQ